MAESPAPRVSPRASRQGARQAQPQQAKQAQAEQARQRPGAMPAALAGGSFSQTLSRGLQVLEVIARREQAMSAGELAAALDVHRSVVYRLVRTLEEHRLLTIEADGKYTLGLGILTLARSVQRDLRQAASGVLAELGERLGATAIIGLVEGSDIVCVASAEPPTGFLHVRYRVGFRHPVSVGAGGLAVLSGMSPQEGERPEVAKARELGYAVSYEELEEGAAAVSAPVLIPHQPIRMSVSVLMPTSQLKDPAEAGRLVIAAAAQVAAMF